MRNTAFWMLTLANAAVASEPPVQQIEVRARASDHDTAAKIVVGSEELARYGDDSVAAALKRVPGVTVTSTGRGSDIRLRGLGGRLHPDPDQRPGRALWFLARLAGTGAGRTH